ncbi:hypothetical protein MWH03_00435 [Klebsiella pneumoniae]|nr:hypothetical protein [Klebsiella pneumoniae]
MKAALINLLCRLVIRLASRRGDEVAQLNIHFESGSVVLFFGSKEKARQAVSAMREIQRLSPDAQAKLAEAIHFASETMEHHPTGDRLKF